MTVKDTVRSSILHYPSSYQNVIDVLIQALLTIGGGYCWSDNGELVDTSDKKPPSIKEALNQARKNMMEQLIKANQLNAVKQHHKDTEGFIIRHVKDVYKREVSIIKNIKKREIDKSLEYTIKHRKEFMIDKNRKFHIFYPTPGYNNIYKIPLNVTGDWLDACKLLYETMVTNIEYVHPDYRKNIPEIKEKIDWVEENRKPSNS